MVSASVRGIGVAVITSTSGCSPFRDQLQTLHDAEAVLLVDDRQAEILPFHVFLEQRVGADAGMRPVPRPSAFSVATFLAIVADPVRSATT